MNLVETSVRFSPGTLDRLRRLAHVRSIETGHNVTWNALVRDCVEKHLLGEHEMPADKQTAALGG